jgi:hypothetical protein
MLFSLKNLIQPKKLRLTVTKTQRELLELLMINKNDFDGWAAQQAPQKVRFQFYFPTAIDFFYDEFKLFTTYFKKNSKEEIELVEIKMTETNFDTIRCNSWAPFEQYIFDFLHTLEESKKIALFEKRKTLFEYQSLCANNTSLPNTESEYSSTLPASPLTMLKPLKG